MLSTGEIAAEVAKVSYKPGWSFKVYEEPDGFENPRILIRAEVPHAYRPEETTVLGIRSFVPPMASRVQLHRWLAWRLERIEVHEMREFFLVDDERLFDPHKEF